MFLDNAVISILVISELFVFVNPSFVPADRQYNSTSSQWIKKATNHFRPKPPGCWKAPWTCRDGETPWTRMRCCKNQCVDVSSDPNSCGWCGGRCRFTWQCCNGYCVDTNRSPYNCGKCGNRCPSGVPCVYGMCGYGGGGGGDTPPWPWPHPPKKPDPWPFKPPHPPKGGDKPPEMSHSSIS